MRKYVFGLFLILSLVLGCTKDKHAQQTTFEAPGGEPASGGGSSGGSDPSAGSQSGSGSPGGGPEEVQGRLWTSKGGGSGVLCFKTRELAQIAASYVKSATPIPDRVLNQRTKLRATERFEYEILEPQEKWLKWEMRTWQDIDKEVMEKLTRISPTFAYRLNQGQDFIKLTEWKPRSGLEPISDVELQVPLPETCTLVQIAYRTSDSLPTSDGGRQVPFGIKAEVSLDERLFGLMPSLDQAMIVHHERIYLMAQAIGHESSKYVRNNVVRQFRDDFPYDADLDFPFFSNLEIDRYKVYLQANFGDHPRYFSKFKNPEGPLYSGAHRFQTFVRFLDKSRERMSSCFDRFPRESGKRNPCLDFYLDWGMIAPFLNDEESFLFIGHFLLETQLRAVNSDYLMNPLTDAQNIELSGLAMGFACGKIRGMMPRVSDHAKALFDQAERYCTSYEKNLNGFITMERDQK